MRKILPFLFLNFIVSAAAVFLVLTIWENTHKVADVQQSMPPTMESALPGSTSSLPPVDAKTIEIQLVIGAGDVSNERIDLKSISSDPVDLQGWEITDLNSWTYIFPPVKIYPGGEINLYTKAGTNSSIELYWNQAAAIWSSGMVIYLRDSAGNDRSKYTIP